MVEWLLFDRVNTETARAAVAGERDLVVLAGPHEADAALAVVELAPPGAQVALDPALVQAVPVASGHREPVEPVAGIAFLHCLQGYASSPVADLIRWRRHPWGRPQ